jgi:predicted ATP-binding protein involved in virulence
MKIKHLKIKNFRGFEDITLEFSEIEPTIIIGINGSGKSSILDCLAIFLANIVESEFKKDLSEEEITAKNFATIGRVINQARHLGKENVESSSILVDDNLISIKNQDINNQSDRTENILITSMGNKNKAWKIKKTRDKWFNFSSILLHEESTKETEQNNSVLTIGVYYRVNRRVSDIKLDVPENKGFKATDAYDGAFKDVQIDFEHFFSWFRVKEDVENELMRDDHDFRDRQLEAARKAIYRLIPEFDNLRVRRTPLRMTVFKQDQELIVDQLSDGEKCLLAMVGDLARRLAIANPGLDDPLQGTGVVLIDEIELHLHPGWQYEIIPALTRTFPSCQFIVTTHSPIVLSQVKPEGIFCLEKDKNGKVIAYHPDSSYGRDTNRILEDLMGVPERPQMFKDQLRELFRFIDEGNLDKAKELQHQLEESIGSDEPEFARADVLIRRKEILGR